MESLSRADNKRRSLVIEKRGAPKALPIGIRDYVPLAAPEPEVLRIIGEESQRHGTHRLNAAQIDRVIKAARPQKRKRSRSHASTFDSHGSILIQ
jgi:hypothetical protein